MKSFKRIFSLLFCLILLAAQIPAFAESREPDVFYATFNISLRHNYIFSQYGVTVYLDDQKVAHMEQGDKLTFGAYMADDRMHTLRFDADKSGIQDRTWTIGNLQHGSVLTCDIRSKRDQIRIDKQDITLNGQGLLDVSPDIESQVKLLGTIIVTAIKIAVAVG